MDLTSGSSLVMTLPVAPEATGGAMALLGAHVVAAIVFAIIGIVVFFLALLLIEKITPFSIMKEIEDEHNQALAIVIGAIVIGISIIIAAAILG